MCIACFALPVMKLDNSYTLLLLLLASYSYSYSSNILTIERETALATAAMQPAGLYRTTAAAVILCTSKLGCTPRQVPATNGYSMYSEKSGSQLLNRCS